MGVTFETTPAPEPEAPDPADAWGQPGWIRPCPNPARAFRNIALRVFSHRETIPARGSRPRPTRSAPRIARSIAGKRRSLYRLGRYRKSRHIRETYWR